jgi:hypothetical protein
MLPLLFVLRNVPHSKHVDLVAAWQKTTSLLKIRFATAS